MSPEAIEALCHTLGLVDRTSTPFRNHYVTGPEPPTEIVESVQAGMMEERPRPGFLADSDRLFMVTHEGKSLAVAAHARRFPPLSRGQARYQRYLDLRDVMPDLTFKNFLKGGCGGSY